MRTVYIPAIEKEVSLLAYVRAVQRAKDQPAMQFKHGLTTWWPTTGAEIMDQFRAGMDERINQSVPYIKRGIKS